MLGYEVSSSLVDTVLGVCLAGAMSWTAYMMKQATLQSANNARTAERLDDLERRVDRIETRRRS